MRSIGIFLYIFFCLCFSSLSQNELKQRVIMNNKILSFSGTQPQIVNSSQNFFNVLNPNYHGYFYPVPNSICDTLGNLLLYTDGFNVYDKNKNIIKNGNLRDHSFSQKTHYNIFIPIEEDNRKYYYLFEAVPYQSGWDFTSNQPYNNTLNNFFFDLCQLQYSIIDISANQGLGAIIKKNVVLKDSVAPTIGAVKHANNIDTWLTVLSYHSNKFLTYKINSCSISGPDVAVVNDFHYIQNAIYVNDFYDFEITFSTKGNYVSFSGFYKGMSDSLNNYNFILPFDNITGKLNVSSVDTFSLNTPFNSNFFTHDSKYFYSVKQGFIDGKYLHIYNTQAKTAQFLMGPYDFLYQDYGYNNDFIVFLENPNAHNTVSSLWQISNIDQPFTPSYHMDSIGYPMNRIGTFSGTKQFADYDPFRNNQIMSFYDPGYHKPSSYPTYNPTLSGLKDTFCYRNILNLTSSIPHAADSIIWNISNGGNTVMNINSPTLALQLSPGYYHLTLSSYKYCIPEEIVDSFLVEPDPSAPLSQDSVYKCASNTITLPDVGENYKHRVWYKNQEPISNTEVRDNGWYTLEVGNSCGISRDSQFVNTSEVFTPNLITANGDRKNDEFILLKNNSDEKIDLTIYSSWGTEVYKDSNYQNTWGGENVESGVYYYNLDYANGCQKKGWVQLIK